MSSADLKKVARKFRKQILDTSDRLGMDTGLVDKAALREIILFLRDDPKFGYNFLRHITCVDYHHREPRFEVVYVLYNMTAKSQIVLKVRLTEDDPTLDSIHDLFGCANWAEREIWDMYGIRFNDHPDMRRILLYEEFDGHPLRKDYAKQASQPRLELLGVERDSVEEFNALHLNQDQTGSRG